MKDKTEPHKDEDNRMLQAYVRNKQRERERERECMCEERERERYSSSTYKTNILKKIQMQSIYKLTCTLQRGCKAV